MKGSETKPNFTAFVGQREKKTFNFYILKISCYSCIKSFKIIIFYKLIKKLGWSAELYKQISILTSAQAPAGLIKAI